MIHQTITSQQFEDAAFLANVGTRSANEPLTKKAAFLYYVNGIDVNEAARTVGITVGATTKLCLKLDAVLKRISSFNENAA